MHGYYDVGPLMTLEKYSKTRGHTLKINKTRFKKVVQQRFFSLRVLNSWDSLPKDIAEAMTLNIYSKTSLTNI